MDSGYGSPRRGGRVEITVYREPLTFVLNERRERKKERKWGDTICTPQCAHTHTSQMWVHREDWVVNTDGKTHECAARPWPCCREGPRHGNQLRPSNFSALGGDRRQQGRGLQSLIPCGCPLRCQHRNATHPWATRPHLLVLFTTGSH